MRLGENYSIKSLLYHPKYFFKVQYERTQLSRAFCVFSTHNLRQHTFISPHCKYWYINVINVTALRGVSKEWSKKLKPPGPVKKIENHTGERPEHRNVDSYVWAGTHTVGNAVWTTFRILELHSFITGKTKPKPKQNKTKPKNGLII